jgi:hypothetical protein
MSEQIIPMTRLKALAAEQAQSLNPVCPPELEWCADLFWHELRLAQFEQSCEDSPCSQ